MNLILPASNCLNPRLKPSIRRFPGILSSELFLSLFLLFPAHGQQIRGNISTTFGVPVPGVTVNATSIRTIPVERFSGTTDAAGNYALGPALGPGLDGDYNVVPSKSGYTFTPPSAAVTVARGDVVQNFTTPSTTPVAITRVANNILATSAVLRGDLQPNGTQTAAWFEYGPTSSYGNVTAANTNLTGTNFISHSQAVTLNRLTTYRYRLVISNQFGVYRGEEAVFTTLSGIPLVATTGASQGSATSMRLNALLDPNGGAPVSAWFQVGTSTNYEFPSVVQNFSGGAGFSVSISQSLVNLTPGTTYHFRVAGASQFGTNYGVDMTFTPVFGAVTSAVTQVMYTGVDWGDYNNDSRLDLLISGYPTEVWRNTGLTFTNDFGAAAFTNVADGALAWADYNNDGHLDFALTGWVWPYATTAVTRVYQNTGNGAFRDLVAGITPLHRSTVAWGDYDRDGRSDLLVTGLNLYEYPITEIWRNVGNGFVYSQIPLPGVSHGAAAWGDYDNDGLLDILLTGQDSTSQHISQIWRNTGSGFTNINAGLPGVRGWNNRSSAAWGDYDADGRLDLVIAGNTNLSNTALNNISQIWRNTGSGFALNTNVNLPGSHDGSLTWGDYDNDGFLDLLLSGRALVGQFFGPTIQVWRNRRDQSFENINAGLIGGGDGTAAWGDYDNNGTLDFFFTGTTTTQLWRNFLPSSNSPPSAPSGLSMTLSNSLPILSWNRGSDRETPLSGLTYNVRIGTTPGGSDVLAPMSAANGFRRVAKFGNSGNRLSLRLNDYKPGTVYYWSVQTIDNGFAGSEFAPEQSFKILPVATTGTATSLIPGDINGDGIVSPTEFSGVLSNYWASNPSMRMTNAAKIDTGLFEFALTNEAVWNFTVQVTTNFTDWQTLGPAFPVYQFHDPQSTNLPQRYYRLTWP